MFFFFGSRHLQTAKVVLLVWVDVTLGVPQDAVQRCLQVLMSLYGSQSFEIYV